MGAGLERYMISANSGMTPAARLAAGKKAIQEANGLEAPLLERNLISLSTIASIGTMVGLSGTTHRDDPLVPRHGAAGHARRHELALGISEALINTAGGLVIAHRRHHRVQLLRDPRRQLQLHDGRDVYEIVQLLGRKDKKLVG